MAFHVGQKVVCVNDDWSDNTLFQILSAPNKPKSGLIYTVRGFAYEVRGFNCIWLEEIKNKPIQWKAPYGWLEPGFYVRRFRPIVEKKATTDTGMAILREILDRETVKDTSPSKVRS